MMENINSSSFRLGNANRGAQDNTQFPDTDSIEQNCTQVIDASGITHNGTANYVDMLTGVSPTPAQSCLDASNDPSTLGCQTSSPSIFGIAGPTEAKYYGRFMGTGTSWTPSTPPGLECTDELETDPPVISPEPGEEYVAHHDPVPYLKDTQLTGGGGVYSDACPSDSPQSSTPPFNGNSDNSAAVDTDPNFTNDLGTDPSTTGPKVMMIAGDNYFDGSKCAIDIDLPHPPKEADPYCSRADEFIQLVTGLVSESAYYAHTVLIITGDEGQFGDDSPRAPSEMGGQDCLAGTTTDTVDGAAYAYSTSDKVTGSCNIPFIVVSPHTPSQVIPTTATAGISIGSPFGLYSINDDAQNPLGHPDRNRCRPDTELHLPPDSGRQWGHHPRPDHRRDLQRVRFRLEVTLAR